MLPLLFLLSCNQPEDTGNPEPTTCQAPDPPAEATLRLGQDPELVLLPNGRAITPVGEQVELDNQLGSIVLDPSGSHAYVAGINRYRRSLHVVDLEMGQEIQSLEPEDAWFGLVMDSSGSTLYASEGSSGAVQAYSVADDGTLSAAERFEPGGYPAGLALSDDESLLYVALYGDGAVAVLDLDSSQIVDDLLTGGTPFSIVKVPGRNELWVSDLSDSVITVLDTDSGLVLATVEASADPEGLVVSPDGSTVYAALSSTDIVAAYDVGSLSLLASTYLAEDITGPMGDPMPAVGPNALALDQEAGILYVARSSDNAVGVLDSHSLQVLGNFPVAWYPDDLAIAPDGRVVVSNMKGYGSGPNMDETDPPGTISGTLSIVDPESIDLAATTATVEDNLRRTDTVYPFDCQGLFPVPTAWGEKSPYIEHVVLIVRENKTFDAVLGDLEGAEGDPDGAIFAEYTPNLHALAGRFGLNDNFYTDSEVSTQGHLWLTQIWVDDFMEKSWMEDYHGGGDFAADPVMPAATPGFGTFFTHLITHDVDFTIFGELVGAFDEVDGEAVIEHLDLSYPGVFFDLSVKDTDRAEYAADQLFGEDGQGGGFPPFVFMLLPDDHTAGASDPTPEAMIADNDAGTGLFIDRLSHSTAWDDTVVFVVEDDPQQGTDHVDAHRSFCLIASPWVKRGHVSQVLTSFPAMFKTIELILGIPPMNRFDALATPMWDSFTTSPDYEPYEHSESAVPWSAPWLRPRPAPELTRMMDFSGPDRAPLLGEWLWWYFRGEPRPGSILERYAAGDRDIIATFLGDDDGDDEIYEQGYRLFEAWLREHPESGIDWQPPWRPDAMGAHPPGTAAPDLDD